MTEKERQELIAAGAKPEEISQIEADEKEQLRKEFIDAGAKPEEIEELLAEESQKPTIPTYAVGEGKRAVVVPSIEPPTQEQAKQILDDKFGPVNNTPRNTGKNIINSIPDAIRSIPEKVKELEIPSRFTNTGRYLTDAYFPRTRERQTLKKKGVGNIIAPALDIATIPGRSFASLSEIPNGPDAVQESMQDIKGTRLAGKLFRSPMTAASVLAAIPTGGASFWPLLGKLGIKEIPKAVAKSRLGSIGAQAAAGATANQLENVQEGKDISKKEVAQDFTFGAIAGGLGEGAGKVIGYGLRKGAEKLVKGRVGSAVDKLFNEIKPSGQTSASGVTKDLMKKHEVIGDMKESGEKTSRLIQDNMDEADVAIRSSNYAAGEPSVDINKLIEDISFSDDMTPGFIDDQYKALKDIIRRTEDVSPDGNVNISDIPKVKHIIAEVRDFVQKPESKSYNDVDKILGVTYHKLDDELIKAVGDNSKQVAKARNVLNEARDRLVAKSQRDGVVVWDDITNKQLDYKKDPNGYMRALTESGRADPIATRRYLNVRDAFNKAKQLQSNAQAVKEANKNMTELIPIHNAIKKKISEGYYDKKPGTFAAIGRGLTNSPNVLAEIFLHNIAPGVSTGFKAASMGASKASPSIAKTLVKFRDDAKMEKWPTFTDLERMSSKDAPLFRRNQAAIYKGLSPEFSGSALTPNKPNVTWTAKEKAEIKAYRSLWEEIEKNRYNKGLTFGVIGSQDPIDTTRTKNKSKSKAKEYYVNPKNEEYDRYMKWVTEFRKQKK